MADGGKILKQDIIEQKPIEDALRSMATLVEDITTKIKALGEASKTAFEPIKNAGNLKGLANENKKQAESLHILSDLQRDYNKILVQLEQIYARNENLEAGRGKRLIEEQIRKKQLIEIIKEEITGEKALAEEKRKNTEANKKQIQIIKAANKQAALDRKADAQMEKEVTAQVIAEERKRIKELERKGALSKQQSQAYMAELNSMAQGAKEVAAAEKKKNDEMQKSKTALEKQRTAAYTAELKKQEAATKLLIKAKNTQAGSVERLRAVNAMYANRMKQLNVLIPAQRAQYDRLSKSMANINTRIAQTGQKISPLANRFSNLIKSVGLYAAAMFGITRIIQFFTRDLLGMVTKLDSLEFSMKTVIKSQAELAATQQFLSTTAANYGQDIITLTERYIKFRAAAMQSNLTVKDTMGIFDSMAKAAGVLGLKTDEVNGVFLAIEQMVSKGKVTTEELRRQLGERLPGAFGIMADAIGVSIVELDKMLKAGEVLSADALPKFAVALEKAYGIEAVTKIDTLAAAQGRLKTSWVSFVDELNASRAYIETINLLSKSLNTIRLTTGKMTKLDYMLSLDNSTSKVLRETIDLLDKMTDEELVNNFDKWRKALSKEWLSPMTVNDLLRDYIIARNKAFKEQDKFNLKPFDTEAYSESLDKLEKDTKSFGNTIDKDLQQNIIESNGLMKSTGKTNYKEILQLEDESLKKKQAIAFTQKQNMEDLKTIRELTKDEAKEYEYASNSYIALTEARIDIANRLADKEKKPKKERDDTLNILRERQKAELEATKQHQQELIQLGNYAEDELLMVKFDNSKELLNQELKGLEEQKILVKDNALETARIDSDIAKLRADLAKDLTDFLIDEEKRRQKELEKIRKQELEDFISDAYEQGALLKIQRAAQARDEMKDAGWNVKKKRAIQLNSAIDMLQIDWDTQQKIIDNDKTSLEEKKRSLEIQKDLEQQFHEDSLNLDVELTKAQIEEWNKRISAMSEISGRVFDIMNTIYDGQLTRIEQLHDYEIAAAGDSVEKRIMAERKYEKEKARIMRKQAIAQKAQTAFEIIINTASAVVEALPNIPLAVIIGALGLTQLGLTLATPIPKFAKGTKNAPETFIAGDSQNSSGASELIMKPDGTAILTPDKPTLFSDKSFVGSTILPADQTQKMLANYAIKQSYDMIDMSESNKTLKNIERNTKNKREVFINKDGRTVIKRGYITSTLV